jgi:metal-sulfur cluster biosynthetic enzyme
VPTACIHRRLHQLQVDHHTIKDYQGLPSAVSVHMTATQPCCPLAHFRPLSPRSSLIEHIECVYAAYLLHVIAKLNGLDSARVSDSVSPSIKPNESAMSRTMSRTKQTNRHTKSSGSQGIPLSWCTFTEPSVTVTGYACWVDMCLLRKSTQALNLSLCLAALAY